MEARRHRAAERPQTSLRPAQPQTEPQRKRVRKRPRRERAARPSESAETVSNDPPLPSDGAVGFQVLAEDITCSVCLDDLQNPVSIACGHTFCRNCITTHWSTPHPDGYLCPECRTQCPRNQITPDYRLMNLIDKIQKGIQDKTQEQECLQPPEQGYPVQLVWTDGNGRLHLDESVVYNCFMNSHLSTYPVYLLCVIGEKRRGKSFLMNYVLRALESQEKGEDFSLGANDEPLQGFEWKCGIDSTTKGIWIWNRPFLVGQKGEKIYLNMGEEFGSERLQFLDILIRDWHDSGNCGRDAARFYISREIEKLQKGRSYPKVLWGLKSSHTRCFLLPHPGKGITGESQGRLQDMDKDFQDNLRMYVADVVRGVWHRIKMDARGEVLTCCHIPSMLQVFVDVLEKQYYGFSTPMEMFYAIKNQKILESIKDELQEFLKNQPYHLLPSTMRTLVSEKSAELTAKFKDSLLGPNLSHHRELQVELSSHLQEEQEKFCSGYTTRFTCSAVTLGVTAGLGIYGVVGAAAARGTVVMAQPAVVAVEKTVAKEVAPTTVALLKMGFSALVGRFFC